MILKVEHISKSYGGRTVIDDLSFTLAGGEVVTLLGHNGSGKTTLLRMVSGLLAPDRGRITVDGHPMGPDDMREMGYLPEERGLYESDAVGRQAYYLLRLKGLRRHEAKQALEQWAERLGMAEWLRRPAGSLSKGMQQRLQLLLAVAHDPKLLVLDEPFSGFDTDNAAMLEEVIASVAAHGAAVLLSTHNQEAARRFGLKTIAL